MVYGPVPAQIMLSAVALRALVIVILFLLMLFFSDRKNVVG